MTRLLHPRHHPVGQTMAACPPEAVQETIRPEIPRPEQQHREATAAGYDNYAGHDNHAGHDAPGNNTSSSAVSPCFNPVLVTRGTTYRFDYLSSTGQKRSTELLSITTATYQGRSDVVDVHTKNTLMTPLGDDLVGMQLQRRRRRRRTHSVRQYGRKPPERRTRGPHLIRDS